MYLSYMNDVNSIIDGVAYINECLKPIMLLNCHVVSEDLLNSVAFVFWTVRSKHIENKFNKVYLSFFLKMTCQRFST